jgi:branched-chain amino acid transport system ATP-binding protein
MNFTPASRQIKSAAVQLSVAGVGKRFGGVTAVESVSIDVPEGRIVSIIGPNGAGKTSLLNMISGFYKPDVGRIMLDGRDITHRRPSEIAALGVARTFQNIRLFKDLPIVDNVKIGGHIHYKYSGTSAILHTNRFQAAEAAAEQEAIELLRIFNLHTRAHDLAKNLPYGDQRRLEIARALAARPKLLLLDEPAAGLNDSETHALMQTIHDIRDRFDIAILLIEHNMDLVMGICEAITVLNFGKTIATGTAEEVRNNALVVEAYLGEPAEVAHL